jgi:tRNA(fMet)-specific endonuclease VapC
VSLRPVYLLDTNICIDLMKHQPPQVAERFASCRVGEVVISAITAAELEYGVISSGLGAENNPEALQKFLLEVPVAPSMGAPPVPSARCAGPRASAAVMRSTS